MSNAAPENVVRTRYRRRPSVLEQFLGLGAVGLIVAFCVAIVVAGLAASSPWAILAGYAPLFILQILAIWPSSRSCD